MKSKADSSVTIYEKGEILVSVDEATGTILSTARLIPVSATQKIAVDVNDEEVCFLKAHLGVDLGEHRYFECDVENANEIIRECFAIESYEVTKVKDDESITALGIIAGDLVNKIHGPYNSNVEEING